MTNFKNTVYDYYSNSLQTLPASSTKTGTIETIGKTLLGVGTLFLTEIQLGGWVFDSAQAEIRKVVSISSDTQALLSDAFTIDIVATAPLVGISFIDAKAVSLSVSVPSTAAADALVDGKTLVKGTSATFDARDDKGYGGDGLVDPIIIDTATGTTTAQVLHQRS